MCVVKGRRQKKWYFWVVPTTKCPPPSPVVVKVSLFVMYSITPDRGGAHKLSFIVFLHVLKASASNGSKNKKWYFFGQKLWSGLGPKPIVDTQTYDLYNKIFEFLIREKNHKINVV